MTLMQRRRTLMWWITDDTINVTWSSDAYHKIVNGEVQNLTKKDQYVSDMVRISGPTVILGNPGNSNIWCGASIYDKNGVFLRERYSGGPFVCFMVDGYLRFATYYTTVNKENMIEKTNLYKYSSGGPQPSGRPWNVITAANQGVKEIWTVFQRVKPGDIYTAKTENGTYLYQVQVDENGDVVSHTPNNPPLSSKEHTFAIVENAKYLSVHAYDSDGMYLTAVPDNYIKITKEAPV